MMKETKFTYNSLQEIEELKEIMQNLTKKMGTLTGEVTNLKRLDQVVMEVKEYFI